MGDLPLLVGGYDQDPHRAARSGDVTYIVRRRITLVVYDYAQVGEFTAGARAQVDVVLTDARGEDDRVDVAAL